jgi:hypothetical protein
MQFDTQIHAENSHRLSTKNSFSLKNYKHGEDRNFEVRYRKFKAQYMCTEVKSASPKVK